VVASAGVRNTHNHPLREVIKVFEAKLANSAAHTYVAYHFDKVKKAKVEGWEQYATGKAIFTTIVTLDRFGNYTWSNQSAALTSTTAGLLIELAPHPVPAADASADAAST
jgi:hypothetical protein